jgi:hypothetical protein
MPTWNVAIAFFVPVFCLWAPSCGSDATVLVAPLRYARDYDVNAAPRGVSSGGSDLVPEEWDCASESLWEHRENACRRPRSLVDLHRNTEDRRAAERKLIRICKVFKSHPIGP